MKIQIKFFNILLFLLLVAGCKPENPASREVDTSWTEEQKLTYFQDSIANRMYNGAMGEGDSLNNFEVFARIMLGDRKAKNNYDPLIYALEEPYIDTTHVDQNKNWFRLTVNPAFRVPYCLIVEKKNKKTYLTAKMTDGSGGYYSGKLNFSVTKVFPDTLYDYVSKELNALHFWSLGNNEEGGTDGEGWAMEGIDNGRYNLVYRWVPQHSRDATTKKLGRLGLRIRALTKLHEIFMVEENSGRWGAQWLEDD